MRLRDDRTGEGRTALGGAPEVAVDVKRIMTRGGRGQIDLLEFCVLTIDTDALFVYCVDEYRLRPQAAAAVTLHDLFCAHGAPARISATEMLPPKDVRIQRVVDSFRKPPSNADDHEPAPPAPPAFPPKYLFDPVTQSLAVGATPWQRLAASYDPEKTPHQNLPGGEMTGAQRLFVDRVWKPVLRPKLVEAGFWKLATIA